MQALRSVLPSASVPDPAVLWDTHGVSNDNGASEDVKERMKQALEAKNKSASKSVPHGSAPAEGKVHDHADREGGKREFRRKSG